MICIQTVRRFCCEDISTIENYDKAMTDMEHTWECHHRLEIGANGEVVSRYQLKRYGLYYNRPASELIFLTRREHRILHFAGSRNPFYGKKLSEEHKRKMSESHKGKTPSEETRKKMSESQKGKPLSEEHRIKIRNGKKGKSNGRLGKHHSEETRKRLSEAIKAYWAKKKKMTKE